MKQVVARSKIAEIIKKEANEVHSYFWKLSGDDSNSLSSFLCVDWEDLKPTLRLCGVYRGETDFINKSNLEQLFKDQCGCECTIYKHALLKAEWFIKIGSGKDVDLPEDLYDGKGELKASSYPVEGLHIKKKAKTRNGAGPFQLLLDAASATAVEEKAKRTQDQRKKKSPRELILGEVCELVAEAARTGCKTIDPKAMSRLRRQLTKSSKEEAHNGLKTFFEKLEKAAMEMSKEAEVTPDRTGSTVARKTGNAAVASPQDLTDQLEEEGKGVDNVVEDFFLMELKEEVLLQSLLIKKLESNRHFEMFHNNGKRMVVVCPPDTQSAASFESEARRTGWIDALLDDREKQEAMLKHLADASPDAFEELAKKRKTKSLEFDTWFTLALARVGGLNDTRLKNARSFLTGGTHIQCLLTLDSD